MSLMVEYKQVEILRNEHVALKDVNLKIGRGEFVYLYGRVGSGKTSLMKSMYAEVPIASGQAHIRVRPMRHSRERNTIPEAKNRDSVPRLPAVVG